MNESWTGRTTSWVRPPIALVTKLAAELRAKDADLIDLGQAVLGLPPPVEALEGARAYLDQPGPHPYSPDPGLPELRDAIAQMLREHKDIEQAGGERVMVTCGANQAFANALVAITQPGDEVITFGPGYFDHGYTIRMAGCSEVEVPLSVDDDRYGFELEAVISAMTSRTRAVALVSPGNPTGAVAPRPFVEALCQACRDRGVWLLSDETYDFLTFEPENHTSPAAVSSYERIVTIGTFSKIFGMAGWRLGYYHGSTQLMEESFKVQDALVVCAPVISQRAVLAALPHLESYLAGVRAELRARRDALLEALDGWNHVKPRVPQGATFLLASLGEQTDDVAVCQRLLREAGVVSVPGSAFGSRGRGSIRLSFGNQPVDRIREAGRRLRSVKLAT